MTNDDPRLTRHLDVYGTRRLVQKVRGTAVAYDVHGGYCYECRNCALVQVWCLPDDKPACWNAPLSGGAWGPSELVGDFEWVADGTEPCFWHPDAKAAYRAVVKVYGRGLMDHRRKQLAARNPRRMPPRGPTVLTDADVTSCLDWLEAKALELIRLARLAPTVIGTHCPWCADWVLYRGEVFDRLLDHVADAHPDVTIRGVTLSDPCTLTTTRGTVTLRPAERPDL
jgi:hypothetical protein